MSRNAKVSASPDTLWFSSNFTGSQRLPKRLSCVLTRASARFCRVSKVWAFNQVGPPSQPFTLGGAPRVWPSSSQANANSSGPAVPSSPVTRPRANSTGDFTFCRYAASLKKCSERSIVSTTSPVLNVLPYISTNGFSSSSVGSTRSLTNSRYSFLTMNLAQAGWARQSFTTSAASYLPFLPNTVFSPSSCSLVSKFILPFFTSYPVKARAASRMSASV